MKIPENLDMEYKPELVSGKLGFFCGFFNQVTLIECASFVTYLLGILIAQAFLSYLEKTLFEVREKSLGNQNASSEASK